MGPGAKAGIKPEDQLVAVNGQDIQGTPGLVRQLYRTGVWSKATYSLMRQSIMGRSQVGQSVRSIPTSFWFPADRSPE